MSLGRKASITGRFNQYSKNLAENTNMESPIVPSGYCLHVPVLLYHHVQPQADAIARGQTSLSVDNGIFDGQMAYLASHGYTSYSADQLVNAILSKSVLAGKPVVITLDDAYLDNFQYAYPSLQKYHLIGNLMVPTGLLGGVSATNSYFTVDELKQMVGSGTMFAYNHTWSHFAMGGGPKEKAVQEVTTAQNQLNQMLGKASPIFVYPYGSGQTIPWVWQLLKDNGYIAAFSTLGGTYQCEGNIMALPRIHIGNAPMSSYGF